MADNLSRDPLFDLPFEARWAQIGNPPSKERPVSATNRCSSLPSRKSLRGRAVSSQMSTSVRPSSAGGINGNCPAASSTQPTRVHFHGEETGRSGARASSFSQMTTSMKLKPKIFSGAAAHNHHQDRSRESGCPLRFLNDSDRGRQPDVNAGFLESVPNKCDLVYQGMGAYHEAFNKASLDLSRPLDHQLAFRKTDDICATPRNLRELWTKPDAHFGSFIDPAPATLDVPASKRSVSVPRKISFHTEDEAVGSDHMRPVSAPASSILHPRNKNSVVVSRCPKAAALDVDMLEADTFGLHRPGADVDVERQRMIEKLYRRDPIVAQFLDVMGCAFATFTTAFRYLDLRGCGKLSKRDFLQCLLAESPPGSKTPQPVEKHLQEILKRMDPHQSGSISFSRLLDQLEGDDAVCRRLCTFIKQVASSNYCLSLNDATPSRQQLEQCLQVTRLGRFSQISREEFLSWLKQLQYPYWHAGDLFDRMSIDGSNELTLHDLLAVFGKGLTQPARSTKVEAAQNLSPDSAPQPAKVGKMRSASGESFKLGRGRPQKIQKNHSTMLPIGRRSSGWVHDARGDIRMQRPDFCSLVNEGLNEVAQSRRRTSSSCSDLQANTRSTCSFA